MVVGGDEKLMTDYSRYGQYYFDDGTQCPNEIEANYHNTYYGET